MKNIYDWTMKVGVNAISIEATHRIIASTTTHHAWGVHAAGLLLLDTLRHLAVASQSLRMVHIQTIRFCIGGRQTSAHPLL